MRNFLCGRELGGIPIDTEIMSDLKTWKSWKGASGDISAVTWSPNGIQFVAGALSKSDQYNRRNNLILGDIQSSCLKEIPDHYIPRPAEETLTMDDPYLFTSVSDVKWVGDRLYTSSFDQTVKIWDATYANISCVQTLKHESKVDVTAVSSFDSGILATGTTSVVVWDARDLENPTPTTLYLDRDTRYRPNVNFTSTALAWGHMPFTKEFLLGGMSGQDGDEQSYKGHLGLWRAREASFETMKVSTNTQNINDLKWHSSLPQFATASPEDPHNARSKGIGTTTKSIVRIFSLDCNLSKRIPSIMEFSCPALDANEITFCPTDGRYITASCTDGATYVWDNRKGDRILHELRHGDPISPIDHDRTREVADVGVRVALWGTAGQFYTGGSDGVLKRWDVRRSTEDALLQNIASFQHEIYSASFSPDQSHLLVGDSGGAVHVLSSGPCADPDIKEFIFEHAPNPSSSNETDEPNERTALNGISTVSTHEEIPQSTFLSVEPAPSRSEKKRRREERRRIKAGQLPAEDLETNGAHREDTVMDTANGKDPDESDGEQLARKLQAERKKKRRHKKRRLLKMMPIISNTESIDLTMDSDSEQRHFQLEQLREALEDDNWFPPSGQIDPNFTTETV
jgi:WD40 repeat protein